MRTKGHFCITAFFVNFSTYSPLRYLNGQIYWLSVPNALSETNICYSQPKARRRTFPSPPGIFSGRRNAPIILIFASSEPIAPFKTVLYGCLSKSKLVTWSTLCKEKNSSFWKEKKNDSCPVMRKQRFYENLRGIQSPTNDWNPESKFLLKRLESSAWNPKSRIQDCLGFPYTGRICTKNHSTLTGW